MKMAQHANEGERRKQKAYALTWAQRLKRVFDGAAIRIEIEKCEKCGGPVKIIVETSHRSIEDPKVIQKILKHLGLDRSHETRSRSPPACMFDPATALP